MSFQNNVVLQIDDSDKKTASFFAYKFADKKVKTRAYTNALGAVLGMRYLEDIGISVKNICNLHYVRKILEEFDIADIELSNIHIDVRVVFDENEIFIPKSHFTYNILPDIYLAIKIDEDCKNAEILGYFESSMINKNNSNDEYYFIEKEKLSPVQSLKNAINNCNSNTVQNLSQEDSEIAGIYMFDMLDNNLLQDKKISLLRMLLKSVKLRDAFVELENFETISYNAIDDSSIVRPEVKQAETLEELPIEDLSVNEEELLQENENVETLELDESSLEEETNSQEEESQEDEQEEKSEELVLEEEAADQDDLLELTEDESNIELEELLPMDDEPSHESEISVEDLSIENENLQEDDNQSEKEDDVNVLEGLSKVAEIGVDMAGGLAVGAAGAELGADAIAENIAEIAINQGLDLVADVLDGAEDFTENLDTLFEDLNFDETPSKVTSEPQAPEISESKSIEGGETIFSNFDDDSIDIDDLDIDKLTEGLDEPSVEDAENFNIDDINIDDLTQSVETITQDKDLSDNISFDDVEEFEVEEEPDEDNFIQEDKISFDNVEEAGSVEIETEETLVSEEDLLNDLDNLQNSGFGNSLLKSLNTEDSDVVIESENSPEESPVVNDDDLNLEEIDSLLEMNSNSFEKVFEETDNTDETIEEQVEPLNEEVLPIEEEPIESETFEQEEHQEEQEESISIDSDIEPITLEEPELESLVTEESELEIPIETSIASEESPLVEEENSPEIEDFSNVDFSEQEEIQAEAETDISDENNLETFENVELSSDIPEEMQTEENVLTENVEVSQDELPQDEIPQNSVYDVVSETSESESLEMLFDENLTDDKISEEYEEMPEVVTPGASLNVNKNSSKNVILITASILVLFVIGGLGMAIKSHSASKTADNSELPSIEQSVPNVSSQESNEDISNNVPDSVPQEDLTTSSNSTPPIVNNKVEEVKPITQPVVSKSQNQPSSDITNEVKSIVWQVPDYLSYSDSMKSYLKTAGKSIKLSLSSDLLLATEYAYSNQIKVQLKVAKAGTVENAVIITSSGSTQIDKIVLQSVKSTLNALKPPTSVIKSDTFNLTITINL